MGIFFVEISHNCKLDLSLRGSCVCNFVTKTGAPLFAGAASFGGRLSLRAEHHEVVRKQVLLSRAGREMRGHMLADALDRLD